MAKKPASGMYKTKARNLTDAQLKRAKGASAAGKRTVSVSDTSRATTGENKGYTLGAGGKRLTGTVIMANGDRAVYKGGKRVTNVPKTSITKNLSSKSGRGANGTGAGGRGAGGKDTPIKSGFKFTGKGSTSGPLSANTKVPMRTPPKSFAGSSVSSSSSKNTYSQYVNANNRSEPRSSLPTSSINPLAYRRRVDALKKAITSQNTRINIGAAQSSTRAKQKSELDRLKKELAQLQQQNKK
jgi:hypothetical protein